MRYTLVFLFITATAMMGTSTTQAKLTGSKREYEYEQNICHSFVPLTCDYYTQTVTVASDSNTDSSDHLASTIDASRKLQSRSRGWKKMHWRKKKMNKKKMKKKKKKKKHGKGGKSGGGKWLLPWGKSGKSGGNSSSKSEKTSSRSNEWKPTLSPTKWSSVHKATPETTTATTSSSITTTTTITTNLPLTSTTTVAPPPVTTTESTTTPATTTAVSVMRAYDM